MRHQPYPDGLAPPIHRTNSALSPLFRSAHGAGSIQVNATFCPCHQVAFVHVDSILALTWSSTAAAATPCMSYNRPCRTPA